MPLDGLKLQCAKPDNGADCYAKFREYGLDYGPSFQTIQQLYVGNSFALSKLKIADHLSGAFDQFILHPSLIDGALQTTAGLVAGLTPGTPYLPFAVDEIELIKSMPHTCYAYAEYPDAIGGNHAGIMTFNILLLSESGEVLVRFRNLYLRPLFKPMPSSELLFTAAI